MRQLNRVRRHLVVGGEPTVLVGMASAAIFGLLSIRLLLRYVRTRDYSPFVAYRLALAVLVLLTVLVRQRQVG